MPLNSTSRGYRVGYVKEVTQGTTPASALTLLRVTGGGGRVAASSIESDELQLNEVSDVIRTAADGTGTINFEYSYGGIHPLLEGLFNAAFTTNVLRVGSTPAFFTIEDQFTDISRFLAFRGCVIEGISISLTQGAKITGVITYRSMVPPTAMTNTTAGTGGPTAAPTNAIMSPVGSVRVIQEGGSLDLGPAGIGTTAFTIEMTRPSIAQPQLGSTALSGLDQAQFICKGTLSLYMPAGASALIDKYLGDTETSLALTIGGASTLRDAYLFTRVKFTEGGPNAVQRNNPNILQLSWQSLATSPNTSAQVTRTP